MRLSERGEEERERAERQRERDGGRGGTHHSPKSVDRFFEVGLGGRGGLGRVRRRRWALKWDRYIY